MRQWMNLFEAQTEKTLLIAVHPGSACGSADFNIGKFEARAYRDGIVSELNSWVGPVLIVDGELSDELPHYPVLNAAIDSALSRADASGFGSGRIYACAMNTPDWPQKVASAVSKLKVSRDTSIGLTGAWYSPNGGDGCVNHTHAALSEAGYTSIDILDSVVPEPDEDPDEEYEDET